MLRKIFVIFVAFVVQCFLQDKSKGQK